MKLLSVIVIALIFTGCNQTEQGFFEKEELVSKINNDGNPGDPVGTIVDSEIETPDVLPEEESDSDNQDNVDKNPTDTETTPGEPDDNPDDKDDKDDDQDNPDDRETTPGTPDDDKKDDSDDTETTPGTPDEDEKDKDEDPIVIPTPPVLQPGPEKFLRPIADTFTIESERDVSCSPLNDGGKSATNSGIIGEVRVIHAPNKNEKSLRGNLLNYLNPETSEKLPIKVFMSTIDVPERKFDKGFKTSTQTILAHEGRDLLEWFNVNLTSDIKLTAPEEEGMYEFMIISDDGSIFSIEEVDGEMKRENLLYSPKMHAPKAICHNPKSGKYKDALVSLKYGKRYRIKLNYFQGPRWRIALQLYWRKIPFDKVESIKKGNKCNNGLSNNARVKYTSDMGFEVIPEKYFNLPGTEVNQCKESFIDTFKLSKKPADIDKVKILIDDVEYMGGFTQVFDEKDKEAVILKLNIPISQYNKHVVRFEYEYYSDKDFDVIPIYEETEDIEEPEQEEVI